jgi:Zn finger protein HypA/HybF involved in hydrogenase expression
MKEEFIQPIKAKCPKCKYEWTTLSPMFQVSCPSCMSKVKIRKYEFVEEQK